MSVKVKQQAQERAVQLADLDAKLAALEEQRTVSLALNKPKQDMSAFGAAMRVSADLLGGIVVGLAIAWGLAWLWPEARVILLIFGFLFGVGIGVYNAWRSANAQFGAPQYNAPSDGVEQKKTTHNAQNTDDDLQS